MILRNILPIIFFVGAIIFAFKVQKISNATFAEVSIQDANGTVTHSHEIQAFIESIQELSNDDFIDADLYYSQLEQKFEKRRVRITSLWLGVSILIAISLILFFKTGGRELSPVSIEA